MIRLTMDTAKKCDQIIDQRGPAMAQPWGFQKTIPPLPSMPFPVLLLLCPPSPKPGYPVFAKFAIPSKPMSLGDTITALSNFGGMDRKFSKITNTAYKFRFSLYYKPKFRSYYVEPRATVILSPNSVSR